MPVLSLSSALGVDHAFKDCSAGAVVGQKEDSFALVGSANGGRRQHTPSDIEPESGKVSKDELEPAA
jgi:hypothetical protein